MASPDSIADAFGKLQKRVIACERCPRLVKHREEIARQKRREFQDWDYWGRPVPGFGSHEARLLVIGLAPAAHGGNRTGRVFTGDPSAQFLMKHLHAAGFANHPYSLSRDDGLRLKDTYITAAVKCVPPGNRPTGVETENCSEYLAEELGLQRSVCAVLVLGRFAFDAYRRFLRDQFGLKTSKLRFKHGAVYRFGRKYPSLYASYHPSPRNTNTGTLTPAMFRGILGKLKVEISSGHNHIR